MAVIETVSFQLKEGTSTQEFEQLNERFQREIVPTLPGLLRREASRSEKGEWLLVLRYKDMESATKAMQADTSDLSQRFMSHIDMTNMKVGHYEIVSE